ncbi:hypothetical protein IQ241_06780 [Romeria aff. gracilis LEGE 07310]|uniref:Uncharacterized protein n=1 Tax=Vasconcelosia minhoensis LEGE 07310 TaxID=915328 RepID=A0A8J7DBW0_9CYAN|nr:hypothetical protein [Romeria gracilis]MBE9077003.1 hypothetical protein [Romeria aff. gracilis LEGE 07310]
MSNRFFQTWVALALDGGLAVLPLLAVAQEPAPTHVEATADGTAIQLSWEDGDSSTYDITDWKIRLLEATDCATLSQVPEKVFSARRIVGTPVVDQATGHIAVPVLLDECVETQQSAVFIVAPQDVGTYALYRLQVPGDRAFPDEFSSYPLASLSGLQYWDGTLLVRQSTASGAEALLAFRPGPTPAGEFATCGIINPQEGACRLCP